MIKILTIIGARPQIIKAAALSRAIKNNFSDKIEEKILHTGQHYDANMSEVFFQEMNIPKPHFNLNIGSGKHGEQTAKMITGIEQVLTNEKFDAIVVFGDTNSTLAGAVAASKIHIPIVHIEAGLRSFNMAMPEEINRIICDQLSTILFAPTETALRNLESEGFFSSKATFEDGKQRNIFNSGDIMYDNSLYFSSIAEEKTDILKQIELENQDFVLATIHRDNNTDNP
ncbi:UDP-N-acetylglucosamine 2-epimerase, partial [Bacteroidales bacterium OttesenSCG-928-I21]|nr:UDP-N-acetylglucosamine 2-epimerase [Bacteroidales bacterium OttesenSCG-928-I21]